MLKKNIGFRFWFYFRSGWSTYFAFLLAALNTLTVTYYLAIENLDSEFQNRRQKMLEDKIDVSAFLIWIIEFYPNSINEYKKNHDIQLKFNLNVQ